MIKTNKIIHLLEKLTAFTIAYNIRNLNEKVKIDRTQDLLSNRNIKLIIDAGLDIVRGFSITESEYQELYQSLKHSKTLTDEEFGILLSSFDSNDVITIVFDSKLIKILIKVQNSIDYLELLEKIIYSKLKI